MGSAVLARFGHDHEFPGRSVPISEGAKGTQSLEFHAEDFCIQNEKQRQITHFTLTLVLTTFLWDLLKMCLVGTVTIRHSIL